MCVCLRIQEWISSSLIKTHVNLFFVSLVTCLRILITTPRSVDLAEMTMMITMVELDLGEDRGADQTVVEDLEAEKDRVDREVDLMDGVRLVEDANQTEDPVAAVGEDLTVVDRTTDRHLVEDPEEDLAVDLVADQEAEVDQITDQTAVDPDQILDRTEDRTDQTGADQDRDKTFLD